MPKAKLQIVAFVLLVACMTACAPVPQAVQIPTLAVLPSATATLTATLTNTFTPVPTSTATATVAPTETETPNALATQVAQGDLTNQALQTTLAALWTQAAASPTPDTPTATATPEITFTPSLTITSTLTPSLTSQPVQVIQPALLYVRATANLRACAKVICAQVGQLHEGDTVMATGMTQGDAVTGSNALWYRVDRQGQQVYVYSQLVADSPPTHTPTTVPRPQVVIQPAAPPTSYSSSSAGSQPTAVPYTGGGIPCRDGTISHAAHRQGACSYHGGIAN